MVELDERLEKWINFHRQTFLWAAPYCNDMAEKISNAHKYVMHIRVRPREYQEHRGAANLFFEFVDVRKVDIDEARPLH